jgi:hypothetical protein
MLLCVVVALPVTFLIVGCAGGASQGQGGQEDHATHHHSANVKLNLHPEHNAGVSGTASFEDTPDGAVVKLDLRNLPKPNTFYLAHIHPGTCAEGETHEHGGRLARTGTVTDTAGAVPNTVEPVTSTAPALKLSTRSRR